MKKNPPRKRFFIWFISAGASLLAFAAALFIVLSVFLDSASFRSRFGSAVKEETGMTVEFETLRPLLFSGFSARNLIFSSPVEDQPPLMKIEKAAFRFNLRDFFRGRVFIREIFLERPVIDLRRDSRGCWNLPSLRKEDGERKGQAVAGKRRRGESSFPEVVLESIRVKDGSVEITGGGDFDPWEIKGLNLQAHRGRQIPPLDVEALISFDSISLKRQELLEKFSASLHLKDRNLEVTSLRGGINGGELAGTGIVEFPPGGTSGGGVAAFRGEIKIKDLDPVKISWLLGGDRPPPLEGAVSAGLLMEGILPLRGAKSLKIGGEIFSPELKIRGIGPIRELAIPVTLRDGIFRANGIAGQFALGKLSGRFVADLRDPDRAPSRARISLSGMEVASLLREASGGKKTAVQITGKMDAKAVITGDLGVPHSFRARGRAEINDGSLSGLPEQKLIGGLTGQARLKDFRFARAEAGFRFSGRVLTLENLIFHSDKVKIGGEGTIDFSGEPELELKIDLNFHHDLLSDIKSKELRSAWGPSKFGDEFSSFEFAVWGNPPRLKNDFVERLAKKSLLKWLHRE